MKSGEEERHFRKGTSYKRPSDRRGVAAEQTYKRERGSRFVDRPAGAYGEADTERLWVGIGAPSSRAQDGEGMGGNVIRKVAARS